MSDVSAWTRCTCPIIMLGEEDVIKECGAMNLPIELAAARTLGSSMHIGTVYFLLLIMIMGNTPIGRDNLPTTFSIILSPYSQVIPP